MSNATTESGTKATGLNWATAIACVAVAGLATWMFWPNRNEIRLVSPDGRHTVTIEATNEGARIALSSDATGELSLRAMRNIGPEIALKASDVGVELDPKIILFTPAQGGKTKMIFPID